MPPLTKKRLAMGAGALLTLGVFTSCGAALGASGPQPVAAAPAPTTTITTTATPAPAPTVTVTQTQTQTETQTVTVSPAAQQATADAATETGPSGDAAGKTASSPQPLVGGDEQATDDVTTPPEEAQPADSSAYYANCAAARAAGVAPLHRGDAGYAPRLDRDGDGVACER